MLSPPATTYGDRKPALRWVRNAARERVSALLTCSCTVPVAFLSRATACE